MKKLFKVVAQQEPFTVNKTDGSVLNKSIIVLQEIPFIEQNGFLTS